MTQADHPTWPNSNETDEVVEDEDQEATETQPIDELAQMTAERDEYLDQLQRSRAEFVNFKRRNDQERAQVRQFVARDVIAQFLPVIDDFERAVAMIPADAHEGWVKGFDMIQSKLMSTVERLGITRVDAIGQQFDPALHEAVATEPGSSGTHVVEVYQNGYRIGETLVRPAMVKTGDAPEPPDNDDESFDA